jgi:hypothetical protein
MRRAKNGVEAAPPAVEVHVIDPNGVYLLPQVKALLKLRDSTVRREVREKRLRVARRAGRYYILGKWLLEWIEQGEIVRSKPAGTLPLHAGTNGNVREA